MLSVENNGTIQDEENYLDLSGNYPNLESSVETPREWQYTMRRSMQEVVRGLYLGPYSAASKSKLDTLLSAGITHIVCVRQNVEAHFIKPNFPDKFKYLIIEIADLPTENIIRYFREVKNFIDEAINAEGQVLVHGNAGISRSAALVLAYLMETYGLTQQKAYAFLQQRRFCINPNDGFISQLREFEPIYQAKKSFMNGQVSMIQRDKRALEIEQAEYKPEAMDS